MRYNNALSMGIQYASLNSCGEKLFSKFNNNKITWIGNLRPTETSIKYMVKVIYLYNSHPLVYLLEPTFQLVDGKRPPHIYDFEAQRLCLYYPSYREWTKNMKIADTIIPWTCEWLFFYEMWIITGVWHGGGVHIKKDEILLPTA